MVKPTSQTVMYFVERNKPFTKHLYRGCLDLLDETPAKFLNFSEYLSLGLGLSIANMKQRRVTSIEQALMLNCDYWLRRFNPTPQQELFADQSSKELQAYNELKNLNPLTTSRNQRIRYFVSRLDFEYLLPAISAPFEQPAVADFSQQQRQLVSFLTSIDFAVSDLPTGQLSLFSAFSQQQAVSPAHFDDKQYCNPNGKRRWKSRKKI